ncbi:hypothetical protein Tco_1525920 [Tanacetum coccineum]
MADYSLNEATPIVLKGCGMGFYINGIHARRKNFGLDRELWGQSIGQEYWVDTLFYAESGFGTDMVSALFFLSFSSMDNDICSSDWRSDFFVEHYSGRLPESVKVFCGDGFHLKIEVYLDDCVGSTELRALRTH